MAGRAISGGARYAWSMSTPNPAAAPYAVLRVDRRKAKAMAAIAASSAHTMREKPTPNADPEGGAPVVLHLADGRTPYQAARHLLEGAERRNRDTVLCREIVLSASPSYFRPGRESMGGVFELDKVKAWAAASLAWAKRLWPDQLASAVLHLDEQTPHMHLLVVPRVKSAAEVWKLNSKALFDRERLREMQTSYGEALAPLGIRRGEPGSQAEHSEVRQFYGADSSIERSASTVRHRRRRSVMTLGEYGLSVLLLLRTLVRYSRNSESCFIWSDFELRALVGIRGTSWSMESSRGHSYLPFATRNAR